MTNLLSAGFSRLFKDKSLWIACLVCCGFSLALAWQGCQSANAAIARGIVEYAEDDLYLAVPTLGLFLAACISMLLGTEYSDGTIRNKLMVGKTRCQVYFAGYLTCFAAGLTILLSWMVGASAFFLGPRVPLERGFWGILETLLILIGVMASYAAIFTLIGTLCTNKALTVVLSLSIYLIMIMVASALHDRLSCPELTGGMTVTANWEFVEFPMEPNPLYLSGTVREVCQAILELLPAGQANLVNANDVIHPVRQLCFSGIVTVLTLIGGMAAFRKKDIK